MGKSAKVITRNEGMLYQVTIPLDWANITIDNLINETGKSRRTISRALKQLKDSGYIARRGSDRAGTWEIIHDRMDSNF